MQVKELAVQRRQVDLEVARVDDHADWCLDGQRYRVHHGVSHVDRLDGKRPNGELFPGHYLDQLGLVQQLVLFEIALHISQRELGGVDGNLDLRENPGQAANVVHVAVGKDDGADMRLVFNQVGDIRNNDIHAQQLRLREHQPGVDHDNVVFPAERKAVHAELAKSAQGNDFQLFCLHLSDSMLPPMGFRGSLKLLNCLIPGLKSGNRVAQIAPYSPGKRTPSSLRAASSSRAIPSDRAWGITGLSRRPSRIN